MEVIYVSPTPLVEDGILKKSFVVMKGKGTCYHVFVG